MVEPPRASEALDPEALAGTIRRIAAKREPVARSAVAMGVIARRLVADGILDVDLTDHAIYQRATSQIREHIPNIEGMRYLENE